MVCRILACSPSWRYSGAVHLLLILYLRLLSIVHITLALASCCTWSSARSSSTSSATVHRAALGLVHLGALHLLLHLRVPSSSSAFSSAAFDFEGRRLCVGAEVFNVLFVSAGIGIFLHLVMCAEFFDIIDTVHRAAVDLGHLGALHLLLHRPGRSSSSTCSSAALDPEGRRLCVGA